MDDKQQPVASAIVIVVSNYQKIAGATTDGDGRSANLSVPADAELSSVIAIKPGVGVDYVLFRGEKEPTSDPYKLAPDYSQPLEFELNGTRHITVRVYRRRRQANRRHESISLADQQTWQGRPAQSFRAGRSFRPRRTRRVLPRSTSSR